jgi:iron complex transport system ATP-binding protein
MLTQTPAHEIGLSVRELVELARYPYQGEGSNTAEADRAAVSQALEVVEMTEMADRVVSTLSGGERLRAHAARVLAQATPIVLLDEPTAALDIAHQERLLGSFTRIAGRDRCVVAVLHDLNAAARHADRILVLDRGHKVADGHPGDVLEGPLLTDVYGHPIEVVAHPIDGGPLVLVAG